MPAVVEPAGCRGAVPRSAPGIQMFGLPRQSHGRGPAQRGRQCVRTERARSPAHRHRRDAMARRAEPFRRVRRRLPRQRNLHGISGCGGPGSRFRGRRAAGLSRRPGHSRSLVGVPRPETRTGRQPKPRGLCAAVARRVEPLLRQGGTDVPAVRAAARGRHGVRPPGVRHQLRHAGQRCRARPRNRSVERAVRGLKRHGRWHRDRLGQAMEPARRICSFNVATGRELQLQ